MSDRLLREITAVALLLGALLLTVALVSHSPIDPSPFHVSSERESPENLVGWLGSTLSAAFFNLIGVTTFLIPVLGAVIGWWMLRERPLAEPRAIATGWTIVIFSLPSLASLIQDRVAYRDGTIPCGGLVGDSLNRLLGAFAGPAGRLAILCFMLLLGGLLVSGVSVSSWIDRLGRWFRRRWVARRGERSRRRRQREEEKDRQRILDRQHNQLDSESEYHGTLTVKELNGKGRFRIVRKVAVTTEADAVLPEPDEPQLDEPELTKILPETNADESEIPPRQRGSQKPLATAKEKQRKGQPGKAGPVTDKVLQEEFDFVEDLESYDLPQVSFLDPNIESGPRDSSLLIEISQLITNKCQEFKVRGEVVNIRTGPVITTYEFRLDSGIKISAVQNLSDDLALALRTESVRIDRIPGRATVGIEVPNPKPEVIRLRQLVDSSEFVKASSLLTLSLGVDIHGTPIFSDLARMPHLLIGGFTGAGKSVGINAMIMSLLYKARPDQVRFILVDPKMVELGVYKDIPHLMTPIIIDPKKAANALGWAVAQMDDRYRLLASLGVRNLEQYNQLISDPRQLRRLQELRVSEENEENGQTFEYLPYIVIIIDELADLMMTSSRAVEESITRLAQKARAVGIHLICATQRPSVDILTGIIKANFTCRIAYKVRSKFDSRTILDAIGAEHLLGRGDMLFLPPGSSNLVRLHGPFVTEKEIGTVVRYIKRFGKPQYLREVINHAPLGGPDKKGKGRRTEVESEDELSDPMYDQAARVVVKTRKASASYIQRRLHLGYTRSARLLDMMEREGLVGPLAGSKGREVLVPPDYFEEVDETHALNPADDGGENAG
jgi:S-DNA-T family DNA segregation ATPase FtsK/SpoIIIE